MGGEDSEHAMYRTVEAVNICLAILVEAFPAIRNERESRPSAWPSMVKDGGQSTPLSAKTDISPNVV